MESKETINIGDLCIYDPLAMTIYRKQSSLNIKHPEFIMLVIGIEDKSSYYTCLSNKGETIVIYYQYLTKLFSRLD